MKVVILSAGQGRRLLPLTADQPKCAVDIAGRSLLEWQIGEISQCDVDEVVVVTGFRAPAVEAILARGSEVETRTFHNPFYANSDNLGTCWIAREEMHEPFVILNGDTLFEARIMQRLLAQDTGAPITLVTDQKPTYDDDDMKVIADGERLVHVGKTLPLEDVNAESIGMMAFRHDGPRLFRDKLNAIMATEEGLKRWYLSAIDELAQDGHVAVCPISPLSWCEVDDHADLEHAAATVSLWYPDQVAEAAS